MTTFPKPGIVRLKGKDLEALRLACFMRDGGCCTKCGQRVILYTREDHPLKADMAHIRNKRMFGDTLDNVKLMCHREHIEEHTQGKYGKPCPPKPTLEGITQ